MRRYLYIILIVLLVFGGYQLLLELRDEFSLNNITLELPEHPEWRIPASTAEEQSELNKILDQPFVYLGKGHQVYAFESADQRYVLKLVKFTYLKPATYLNFLPNWTFINNYKDHLARGKRMRIDRVFAGYRIAYEMDKENSGLIYIHLMPTTTLNKTIILKNRLGQTYSVNLDQHAFILQKKAIATRTIIQNLLNRHDIAQAKERFRAILDLYIKDYQKGLYDNDHNVMYNTGFAGNQAMRLDAGRLKFDPNAPNPEFIKADLNKIVYKRIRRWLKAYYPQYADELVRDMETQLAAYG